MSSFETLVSLEFIYTRLSNHENFSLCCQKASSKSLQFNEYMKINLISLESQSWFDKGTIFFPSSYFQTHFHYKF